MGFLTGLSAVLAFRTVPTTILITVIYAAIFSALLITDQLPSVPKRTQGLDFQQAYRDLHEVCCFHGYTTTFVQFGSFRWPLVRILSTHTPTF
jgi:hypothetical protein